MFQMILYCLGASMVSMLALFILYVSWKKKNRPLAYLGAVAFSFSLFAWAFSVGSEYGIVTGLFIPGLLVWVVLPFEYKLLAPAPLLAKPKRLNWSAKNVASNGARFIVNLILSALAVSFIVCVGVYYLPMPVSNRLALGIVLIPLIWGTWSYLFLKSYRPWLHAVFMLLVVAAGIVAFL